jgi:hypothetical protein
MAENAEVDEATAFGDHSKAAFGIFFDEEGVPVAGVVSPELVVNEEHISIKHSERTNEQDSAILLTAVLKKNSPSFQSMGDMFGELAHLPAAQLLKVIESFRNSGGSTLQFEPDPGKLISFKAGSAVSRLD